MITIKSYTDISQSKILAEILPLESADMYYPNRTDIKYQGALPIEFKHGNPLLSQEIAAWSLAALLNILNFPSLTQNKEDEWEVCVPNCESDEYIEVSAVNPVDACVEMILKLHKLKML